MEIFPTIEALLHYANAHLLLDELDYVYARNRILDLLCLDEYEEYEINYDEVEAMASPDEILGAICGYALSQKVIGEREVAEFKRRLMDCVIKRPGEIADIFMRLTSQKAFELLHDYSHKSGYIQSANKKWEAKSTKGRFDIAFSGCKGCCTSVCEANLGETAGAKEKNNTTKAELKSSALKKIKYPLCKYCRDNEGFKSNLNLRTVPLDIYGERMFFYYKRRSVLASQGILTSEYHRPFVLDKTAFNKMFDFLAICPNWVIAAKEETHESYEVFSRATPFNKAPDIARFKSKDYPYIAISTVEWYTGAVRLVATNREKLIEYAQIILDKWAGINSSNKAIASLKKADANNFCLELVLYDSAKQVEEGYGSLTDFSLASEFLGVFSLNQKTEDAMAHAQRFLTREEKFTPAKLDGALSEHSALINRLLSGQGSSKPTALEASLDIRDEIGRTLEGALTSKAAPIDSLYEDFGAKRE